MNEKKYSESDMCYWGILLMVIFMPLGVYLGMIDSAKIKGERDMAIEEARQLLVINASLHNSFQYMKDSFATCMELRKHE